MSKKIKNKYKTWGTHTARLSSGPNRQIIPEENTGCCTLEPAWKRCKTKQLAFTQGQGQGYRDGFRDAESKHKQEALEFQRREQSVRLEAVRQIAQAGSSIMEAMAKALLSYDKNL